MQRATKSWSKKYSTHTHTHTACSPYPREHGHVFSPRHHQPENIRCPSSHIHYPIRSAITYRGPSSTDVTPPFLLSPYDRSSSSFRAQRPFHLRPQSARAGGSTLPLSTSFVPYLVPAHASVALTTPSPSDIPSSTCFNALRPARLLSFSSFADGTRCSMNGRDAILASIRILEEGPCRVAAHLADGPSCASFSHCLRSRRSPSGSRSIPVLVRVSPPPRVPMSPAGSLRT
jgi:hypothetical protein